MKNTLFIILFSLVTTLAFSQSNEKILISSCCEDGRGCTGSTYCSACKNCSGCKHCAKNGGSCGVCNGGSTKRYNSPKKSYMPTIQNNRNFAIGQKLLVVSPILNLREGPGTNYKILGKLSNKDEIIVLDKFGRWLKVKVKDSKKEGYVYDKYVRKL